VYGIAARRSVNVRRARDRPCAEPGCPLQAWARRAGRIDEPIYKELAMIFSRNFAAALLPAIAGILLSGLALAQTPSDAPAIEGYSPVSYFTEGRPEKGSKAYAARYNDRTYWLTDASQKALFEADPEAYAPIFPNHCPFNLALGRRASIDPTNFKIAGDTLLMFHRSEEMDGLERWNEHGDEEELMERAESQWTLFEF